MRRSESPPTMKNSSKKKSSVNIRRVVFHPSYFFMVALDTQKIPFDCVPTLHRIHKWIKRNIEGRYYWGWTGMNKFLVAGKSTEFSQIPIGFENDRDLTMFALKYAQYLK